MNLRPKSSVFGLVGKWIIHIGLLDSFCLQSSCICCTWIHSPMELIWLVTHDVHLIGQGGSKEARKASCKPHLTFPATWAQTDLETWWACLWHYVSVMQAPHDFYSCGPHDKLELELELLPPTSRISPAIVWNAGERILWEGTNRGERKKQREKEEGECEEEDLASAYSFWGWIFAVESSRSWS